MSRSPTRLGELDKNAKDDILDDTKPILVLRPQEMQYIIWTSSLCTYVVTYVSWNLWLRFLKLTLEG